MVDISYEVLEVIFCRRKWYRNNLRFDVKTLQHIAIIMDGNGRWAKERGYSRTYGHNKGAETVHKIVTASVKKGLKYLTLFAFSTENWKRPQKELSILMKLLSKYLDRETQTMMENNVRFCSVGYTNKFSSGIQQKLKKAIEKTKMNRGMTLTLALNYGGKQEIQLAVQNIAKDILSKEITVKDITKELIDRYLETYFLPNPDIIIRTSGEKRLSNFLLWKASYAELFFLRKNWPSFSVKDLNRIIHLYHKRGRRFGGVYKNSTDIR